MLKSLQIPNNRLEHIEAPEVVFPEGCRERADHCDEEAGRHDGHDEAAALTLK